MMADHLAAPRDDDPPPAPAPSAWSMPHVGPAIAPPTAVSASSAVVAAPTPAHLHPGGLQGLSRDAQTREACRQVFVLVRDAWLADPSLDDDALMGRLRGGIEDLRTVVGHLEPMSLAAQMHTELCGVGPLDALLRDGQVQELLLQGPTQAKVVRPGQAAVPLEASFTSDAALAWVVSRLTGAPFGPENPVLEATTADGHRVHAIHQCLAVDGPVVSIRRAQTALPRYDLGQLTASATISDSMAKLLAGAVAAGLRLAIFAGPGANPFQLAAALALSAPASQRLVVVRPDHEAAQLPADTVILESARPAAMPGLVEGALGLSPARLLVHGIAGEEASPALAALGRGLQGVVLTSRASTAEEGLHQLAALSGLRSGHGDAQTRSLRVAVSLDLLVVVHRFGDGITRVTQVATSGVSPSGTPLVTDLVNLDPHTRNWTHTAALQTFTQELEQRGISMSMT